MNSRQEKSSGIHGNLVQLGKAWEPRAAGQGRINVGSLLARMARAVASTTAQWPTAGNREGTIQQDRTSFGGAEQALGLSVDMVCDEGDADVPAPARAPFRRSRPHLS